MDRTEANTGTRDVAQHLRFDVATLERWMGDNVDGFNGPLTVSQFKGGQQPNLSARHAFRPAFSAAPPGKRPGAHAVDREARVMSALGIGFRYHASGSLRRRKCHRHLFVMDLVEGIIWETSFPG
jgi:aminoglycoside phosphotransferase (APT) family kinase protein